MPTAVVAALGEQGIEVKTQLVSNVKNRMQQGSTRPWKAKRSEAGVVENRRTQVKPERGAKAQAIRDALIAQGLDARPKDVIAALAAQGIKVTSGQVVTIRKSMGGKGRKRRKSHAGRPAVVAEANGATLNVDHLVAAKKLAEQVGGIDVARKALDALNRLS
jgi:hypothetical protein